MSLTDEIRSGSNEAIKQLYQENAQDVYEFAKGITGNHDTAMEATKNTLSKLVQQIKNGNEPANIHSEALKLAYDEACKIAMPSVQNVKSPYEEEKEAPVKEKRKAEPVREKRPAEDRPSRRKPQYEDSYDRDDYEEAPRRSAQRGNRRDYDSRQQPAGGRGRQNYYDNRGYDDYDDRYDYDDYEDYREKRGHGAGFYICLVINIILVLLLIWFLIGLLINLGVIPDNIDLGYTWFDNTIYPLF